MCQNVPNFHKPQYGSVSDGTEPYNAEATMMLMSRSFVKAFSLFYLFVQDGKEQGMQQLETQHVFCIHRKADKIEIARH